MQQPVFFQPVGAWVGDVIPWQEHGEFSLFYLHEMRRVRRSRERRGTW